MMTCFVRALAIAFFVGHGVARGLRDYEVGRLAATRIAPLLARAVAGLSGRPPGVVDAGTVGHDIARAALGRAGSIAIARGIAQA